LDERVEIVDDGLDDQVEIAFGVHARIHVGSDANKTPMRLDLPDHDVLRLTT
jgi:hypothetical protein